MTPHCDYIKEKTKEAHSLLIQPLPVGIFEALSTATETIAVAKQHRAEMLSDIIIQIYQDGYRDGYDERQALGDLN